MKTINIMTSCDGNLMKFIPVELESIAASIKNRNVNFYLFHDGKDQSLVDNIKAVKYENIKFYDVVVKNAGGYGAIARAGGGWCAAAYYSLCAHKYLPDDMDRILYLDAADIMVIGNIDDYYFDDFDDKMLIVTAAKYAVKDENIFPYEPLLLLDKRCASEISRGLFNSGSYVINLNKMREQNYDVKDYFLCAQILYNSTGRNPKTYFGDQGFFSLLFVGNIKYFDFPKIADIYYMPYNFCLWYFDKQPQRQNYKARIVHFVGKNIFKPWKGRYETFLKRFQSEDELFELDDLNINQIHYYKMWYEYALMADKRLNDCGVFVAR